MPKQPEKDPLTDRSIGRIRSGLELLIEVAGRRGVAPADALTVALATAAGWLGQLVGPATAVEALRTLADDLEALEAQRGARSGPAGQRGAAREQLQ